MVRDRHVDVEDLILRSAEGASRRMIQKATPANALRRRFAAPKGESRVFHVKQGSAPDEV
jgi:hypothetical protein